jgi:ubiquinone/menaquinone biosynthesis C-methylase UbiE
MFYRKAIWNLYASYYNLVNHFPAYEGMMKDVLAEVKFDKGISILDAGCGTGNFEERIQSQNINIEGIDYSQLMINKASKKLKGQSNFIFKQCNLEKELPYSGDKFDYIVCINTIHVIENYNALLKEFNRILKSGGKILMVVPRREFNVLNILKENIRLTLRNNPIKIFKVILLVLLFFPIIGLIASVENQFSLNHEEALLKIFSEVRIKKTYADQSLLISAIKI